MCIFTYRLNRPQKLSTCVSALKEPAPPVSPSSSSTPPPSHSTPSTTVTFKSVITQHTCHKDADIPIVVSFSDGSVLVCWCRYESSSGSSCSNLDSEISEAQTPTYTYRVSPQPPPCPPTTAQSPPLSLPISIRPIPYHPSSIQQQVSTITPLPCMT